MILSFNWFKKIPFLFLGGGLLLLSGCVKTPYHDAFFPITFIPRSGEPQTEVKIEDNFYSLMIDLGATHTLSLRTDLLEHIQKTPLRTVRFHDIRGNNFTVNAYVVPEIKIRNMNVRNLEVQEESFEFITKGSTIYDPSERADQVQGRIGMGILGQSNLFMDFSRSVMFACSDLYDRKREGYYLKRLTPVPFELISDAVILTAETDLGRGRFLLDTGVTVNVMKSSLCQGSSLSSKLILGGRDFGEIDLTAFDIAPNLTHFDGVLGLPFLKTHVVYLDFTKRQAWIGKASECKYDGPHHD